MKFKWLHFLSDTADTLAIVLLFVLGGSGFLLMWWQGRRPVTGWQAGRALLAGMLTGCMSYTLAFGWMSVSIFFAPVIGIMSGLVGIFFLSITIKVGENAENDGDGIAKSILAWFKKKVGGQ